MTTEIKFTPSQIEYVANLASDMYVNGIKDSLEAVQRMSNQALMTLPSNRDRCFQQLFDQLKQIVVEPNETSGVAE